MEDEFSISKNDLKLIKRLSRKNNKIPVCKVIKNKKKYSRRSKYKKDFVGEFYAEGLEEKDD